jgi:uncharacterized FAD-dependent dehydrogenase
MPLLLSEIRLIPDQDKTDLKGVVADLIRIPHSKIQSLRIVRRTVDARHGVRIIYQVEIVCPDEKTVYQKCKERKDISIQIVEPTALFAPRIKRGRFAKRPIVVGFGPAGIFASLILAQAGADPIVLERGGPIQERVREVETFWSEGAFLPESNVCFGEGGAGTFSDGKLTTRKRSELIPWFLQELVEAGAPSTILYESRPHIGTDRLRRVILALREKVETRGGEVRFRSRMTDLLVRESSVAGIQINGNEEILTDAVILAPGHGAGDTFEILLKRGVKLESKPMAMGVRVEHPQDVIDKAQYSRWAGHQQLGPSDYRLTYQDHDFNRGVYSFCMCPGGRVIAANSESQSVVTNGMSTYGRNSGYANSGLVVTVRREDFGNPEPLSGLAYLRDKEKAAYEMGGGRYAAPAQRVTDFLKNKVSSTLPYVTYRPGVVSSDLNGLLPDFVAGSLKHALKEWGRKISGFVSEDVVLIGVETRTSSPVRILRNSHFSSVSVKGLYPVGEGAGYAGGIVSSALDGVQCICNLLNEHDFERQGIGSYET